ncbi:MAG: hypothetical protein R3B82_24935 [Sandaracinaceae bacterium]
MQALRSLVILSFVLAVGCGGGATSSGGGGGTTPAGGTPRPGGGVDLLTLAPSNANVVLHADLNAVRNDPVRYERIASQLATELGLSAESATVRTLLDLTDEAVGVFGPGSGTQDGMLVFSGRYGNDDFDHALAIATARHGATPGPEAGADGRLIYALGNATLAKLDQWTWAIAVGPSMRAHLSQMALAGGRRFGQSLIEFGPRIGLPSGSTQAWANQNEQVGVDMVALVFAGENPQMVHNFVTTVMRHLGL